MVAHSDVTLAPDVRGSQMWSSEVQTHDEEVWEAILIMFGGGLCIIHRTVINKLYDCYLIPLLGVRSD